MICSLDEAILLLTNRYYAMSSRNLVRLGELASLGALNVRDPCAGWHGSTLVDGSRTSSATNPG
jgi:hypothetical protein